MKRLALLIVLLVASGCSKELLFSVDEFCYEPTMSYMPYSNLGFAGAAIPLQVVIQDSCKTIERNVYQNGQTIVFNLTSTPIANCANPCTGGQLPQTHFYIITSDVDFEHLNYAEELVVFYDGGLVERFPLKGTYCSEHSCPPGYACISETSIPGPDGVCLPIDCKPGVACEQGYSCLLESPAAGACVKDIPIDYCERDEDCVRQPTACDCGLGTWVNHRFYNPTNDGPQCRCAWRDARGVCEQNHCIGVAEQLSEPAVE